MWEQAEVTVVSRVISVAPPDLQELTPIHSSDRLPAGKGTHTETQKNALTPACSANGRSVVVGRVPFAETYCDGVQNCQCFLLPGAICVSFLVYISLFMRAACWCLS